MQDIKRWPKKFVKRQLETKTYSVKKPQKNTAGLIFTPDPEYVSQQLKTDDLQTIEQLWNEIDHGEENELRVLSQKISENSIKLKENLKSSLQSGIEENTRRLKGARETWNGFLEQPVDQTFARIAKKTKALKNRNIFWVQSEKIQSKKNWADNFVQRKHKIYARWYAFRKNKFAWRAAAFAVLAVIIIASLQGAIIYAQTQSAKLVVLNSASMAVANLKNAAQLAQQKNLIGAQQQLDLAQQNFSQAKNTMAALGLFLNSFTSQGQSSDKLLDAGERASLAAQNLSQFYTLATQIKITPAGFSSPDGFYQTANAAENYLQKSIDDLLVANNDLSSVDQSALPANIRSKFGDYKNNLNQALNSLQQVHDLINLFQQFIGPGQKNILVLFENNRELRPTGGFIGTYGYFRLNDGVITNQKISSIYDLDGQLSQKIAPPGPFHDLTDHWGLRDSNWFPDFSKSAQKAISFYEMEGMETPDAVIAMTPDLFVDLLALTGPVDFPKYNLTLSADNFRDVVQTQTSQANNPKQMLADFMPLFMQKLANLKGDLQTQAISTILQNFQEKNILIYDRNPEIESAFQQYNWTGNIASTSGDYLAIYNANLGGKKTDLDITQHIALSSAVDSAGGITNTVTYTRTQGQSTIDPNTPNIDYARFLVPQGSTFISASGFTKRPHYLSDGSGYQNSNGQNSGAPFIIDSDLQKIDASTTIDDSSGTAISTESGKTEFGNWIQTSPGQTATVVIKYKLPFKITDDSTYSLVVQKQPGDNNVDFSYIANIGKQLLWYVPDNLSLVGGSVQYTANLKSDIFIGAVFSQ